MDSVRYTRNQATPNCLSRRTISCIAKRTPIQTTSSRFDLCLCVRCISLELDTQAQCHVHSGASKTPTRLNARRRRGRIVSTHETGSLYLPIYPHHPDPNEQGHRKGHTPYQRWMRTNGQARTDPLEHMRRRSAKSRTLILQRWI